MRRAKKVSLLSLLSLGSALAAADYRFVRMDLPGAAGTFQIRDVIYNGLYPFPSHVPAQPFPVLDAILSES